MWRDVNDFGVCTKIVYTPPLSLAYIRGDIISKYEILGKIKIMYLSLSETIIVLNS